jgi:hypothetical protein
VVRDVGFEVGLLAFDGGIVGLFELGWVGSFLDKVGNVKNVARFSLMGV